MEKNSNESQIGNTSAIQRLRADEKMRTVYTVNLTFVIFAILLMIGYACVLCHSGFKFLTYAGLLALACFAGGLFMGFLFGIPRTLTNHNSSQAGVAVNLNFGVNTNMEQISDWLTKIIVGVGLVQMHKILIIFGQFTRDVGPALVPTTQCGSNTAQGQVLTGAIVIFFLVEGFLAAYLWTRLYLAGVQNAEDINDAITQNVKEQDDKDKAATKLEAQQLTLPIGATDITSDKLSAAFQGVSGSIINDIFIRAEYILCTSIDQNTPNAQNKLARTIPIFKALISLDTDNKFPENHEQLAYALFKKIPPDYSSAEQEFSTAIKLYGTAPPPTMAIMLYYRAVCRIKSYCDDAITIKPSSDKITLINQDIADAKKDSNTATLVQADPTINAWTTLMAT